MSAYATMNIQYAVYFIAAFICVYGDDTGKILKLC